MRVFGTFIDIFQELLQAVFVALCLARNLEGVSSDSKFELIARWVYLE